MKTMNTGLAVIILLVFGLYTSGCHRRYAATPSIQTASRPSASVTVEISIKSLKPEFSSGSKTTYDKDTQTQPKIVIYWDGKEFTAKSETGQTLMSFIPDLAFDKQAAADFEIKKKVTVKNGSGTSTFASSWTTTVKRGAAAKM